MCSYAKYIYIYSKYFLISVCYNLNVQHKSVFIGLKDAEGKPELLNMQLCGFWYGWIVYGSISLLQNTISTR